VALRNIRREMLDELREYEREKLVSEDDFYRGKDDIQDLTNRYSEQMDEISARKQQEVVAG
jgi:ribosome recycling factor